MFAVAKSKSPVAIDDMTHECFDDDPDTTISGKPRWARTAVKAAIRRPLNVRSERPKHHFTILRCPDRP